MKIDIMEAVKKVNWKKVGTYGAAIGMAAMAAISDQKKEDEFKSMKEQLAKLTKEES